MKAYCTRLCVIDLEQQHCNDLCGGFSKKKKFLQLCISHSTPVCMCDRKRGRILENGNTKFTNKEIVSVQWTHTHSTALSYVT